MPLLKDLLSSKKFVVFLATVILSIANKAGLNLDPEMMKEIVTMAAAYIVGQGIADHGKEAAKVAAAANDNQAPTPAQEAA